MSKQIVTEGDHKLRISSEGIGCDTHIYVDGKEMKNISKAVIIIQPGEPVCGKLWVLCPELDFKEEVYQINKRSLKKYREGKEKRKLEEGDE